jgi:hypothetical protein
MRGAEALAQALPRSPQLLSLKLSQNSIPFEGCVLLASALCKSSITSLALNQIADDSVLDPFFRVLQDTKLTSLDVCHDGDASLLAASLPSSSLTELTWFFNKSSTSDIEALASVLAHSKLTALNLSEYFTLSASDVVLLIRSLKHSRVRRLILRDSYCSHSTKELANIYKAIKEVVVEPDSCLCCVVLGDEPGVPNDLFFVGNQSSLCYVAQPISDDAIKEIAKELAAHTP